MLWFFLLLFLCFFHFFYIKAWCTITWTRVVYIDDHQKIDLARYWLWFGINFCFFITHSRSYIQVAKSQNIFSFSYHIQNNNQKHYIFVTFFEESWWTFLLRWDKNENTIWDLVTLNSFVGNHRLSFLSGNNFWKIKFLTKPSYM